MFSNLLQVLYGSADLFVVGPFGHTFDVSGVSIGSQTMALITNLIFCLKMDQKIYFKTLK